jgi:hypothetical protein
MIELVSVAETSLGNVLLWYSLPYTTHAHVEMFINVCPRTTAGSPANWRGNLKRCDIWLAWGFF